MAIQINPVTALVVGTTTRSSANIQILVRTTPQGITLTLTAPPWTVLGESTINFTPTVTSAVLNCTVEFLLDPTTYSATLQCNFQSRTITATNFTVSNLLGSDSLNNGSATTLIGW
jgi:hypothetical protein